MARKDKRRNLINTDMVVGARGIAVKDLATFLEGRGLTRGSEGFGKTQQRLFQSWGESGSPTQNAQSTFNFLNFLFFFFVFWFFFIRFFKITKNQKNMEDER